MNRSSEQLGLVDFGIAFRISPLRGKFSPLLIADVGYSIELGSVIGGSAATNGYIFSFGIGERMNFGDRNSITFSVCYKAQQFYDNVHYYSNGQSYNSMIDYTSMYYLEALCLELGFVF